MQASRALRRSIPYGSTRPTPPAAKARTQHIVRKAAMEVLDRDNVKRDFVQSLIPGDVILLEFKSPTRKEPHYSSGIVTSVRNQKSHHASVVIRNVYYGCCVDQRFPLFSPNLTKAVMLEKCPRNVKLTEEQLEEWKQDKEAPIWQNILERSTATSSRLREEGAAGKPDEKPVAA